MRYDMAMDDRLKEIATRLTNASKHRGRPWIATDDEDWADNWLVCSLGASNLDDGKNWYVTTDRVHASEYDGDAQYDAVFIANAPADITYLMDELAQAKRMIDQQGKALDIALERIKAEGWG